ncbi:MAG: sugar O-acetyltransferase [Paludibacterium sp.]|nr:sugar O-acetyltransferase [Paludibacterium sp.]MBV8648687.1 sugar O-acetyltransferase [Paludibacterium sp.]
MHRDRTRGQRLLARFNAVADEDRDARHAAAAELFAACPPSCVIKSPFLCEFGRNIRFGENTFVNFNVTIIDLGEVEIGSHVLIAPNVQIYTATHPLDFAPRRDWQTTCRKVTIEDDCWIGGGAILLPGVTIGARSIVGAGAVVTRDVPPDSLAVGNPARVSRRLNPD